MSHASRAAVWTTSLLALAACGGRTHEECPDGTHEADPDGHGARCIDDASTCESAAECEAPANPCCTTTCADVGASGVYACVDECPVPACHEDSECGQDWRCETGVDLCDAWCVPAGTDCPEGQLVADVHGTGAFECVREDSSCFADATCPASADGCCLGRCGDQGGALFACGLDCGGGGAGADEPGGGAAEWMCATDADCETMMGQPGWTCERMGCNWNDCVAPAAECETADDCVIATDLSNCCGCADAYSWSEVNADSCLVPDQSDPGLRPEPCPESCAEYCDVDCAYPAGVECAGGQCVAVW